MKSISNAEDAFPIEKSQEYHLSTLFSPLGANVAAGECGGHKTSPHTSTIVHIFYFWSFEISMNILRNQK